MSINDENRSIRTSAVISYNAKCFIDIFPVSGDTQVQISEMKNGMGTSLKDTGWVSGAGDVTLTFSFFLLLMIRSRPLKAPEATKRMLVVSTCTVSPLSFLEFFSGTLTMVPSSSFSRPWNGAQDTK